MYKDKSEVVFSDDASALIQKIIRRYPDGRQKSALLPLLHIAQAEFGGWLSAPVMDKVAEILNIQSIEVYEVASFYSMFNLKPVGRCVIEVCRTGPCWLLGAEDIVKYLEKKLNIKEGQTTARRYHFSLVERQDQSLNMSRQLLLEHINTPGIRGIKAFREKVVTVRLKKHLKQ
ncbi:MAG: NAD(P)H-dependent oxidoreductase subunit E [Bacteroidetes bacterium]|nr:NAD(P)H-dependent oxidoreductase subunit E [Bacteroidota bacterium]